MTDQFQTKGWCRFDADPAVSAWVAAALPFAHQAVADPANAHWMRCGGTWFAGVNALDNDKTGAIGGGSPLAGRIVDHAYGLAGGRFDWDRAQVSVCYPGYPAQGEDESDASFAYRLNRDSAHVDGLLPVGPARRRFLREHHRFILGLPVGEGDAAAAPTVVWEGSHRIMRAAFTAAFGTAPPHTWRDIDVTDVYHAARRKVFADCRKVTLTGRAGEAYLIHRLALHGIAPWGDGATSASRLIIFFRPELAEPAAWLKAA